MSDTPIGKLADETSQRDAIHIAIAPVTAGEKLYPGDDVGFRAGDCETAWRTGVIKPIGIVDPFLKLNVRLGQRFFIFLYPNTVTGMRHHWEHPAFTEAAKPVDAPFVPAGVHPHERDEAERWLRDFAAVIDITYEQLIQAGRQWNDHEEYTTQQGDQSWQDGLYENASAYWSNWEMVTGEKAKDKAAHFFSCSC